MLVAIQDKQQVTAVLEATAVEAAVVAVALQMLPQ
jgi:hypothetical protein